MHLTKFEEKKLEYWILFPKKVSKNGQSSKNSFSESKIIRGPAKARSTAIAGGLMIFEFVILMWKKVTSKNQKLGFTQNLGSFSDKIRDIF